MMKEGDELRANLWRNANHFRKRMEEAGFTLAGKDHAIIPVMLGGARLASEMADKLLEKGIYVIGFSYPVVPKAKPEFVRKCRQVTALNTLIKP